MEAGYVQLALEGLLLDRKTVVLGHPIQEKLVVVGSPLLVVLSAHDLTRIRMDNQSD